ncbi:hypothetical protein M1446_04900 [Candidatus Dependentiae bacterium]|nr:hypothetical protein [Candidatus Dependentiae bacterium]
MLFLKKIVVLFLVLNLFQICCNTEIEDAIKKRDLSKLKQVLDKRLKQQRTQLDLDATNIENYLSIADQMIKLSDDEIKHSNKRRIALGSVLVGISLYKLISNILFISDATDNKTCRDSSIIINSSASDILSYLFLCPFGMYQLYLGFTNKDAEDKLANAVATKHVIENLQNLNSTDKIVPAAILAPVNNLSKMETV